MPNRIIKESICTSDSIASLSDFQESFFYRLIVNCDDYGRMDARPAILKARLYPLRERLTLKDIQSALRALADVGCVEVYLVDGKPYLRLPSWEVHQQIRAKKSKYPAPDSDLQSQDSVCNQLISDDCKCHRNPIQSESESESTRESESEDSPEPQAASVPPVITFPLNTGEEFPIFPAQVAEFESLYPAVDVMQELRNYRGWCLNNPKKRKTRSGIMRSVNTWLSREQDKPHFSTGVQSAKKSEGEQLLDMIARGEFDE